MTVRRRFPPIGAHRQLGLYRRGRINPALLDRFEDLELPPFETAALFAGIGGIELGLERAGHRTSLFCEVDNGAIAVLEKQFPGIPVHPDVRNLRSKDIPSGVGLLTAGFPCQDLSQVGQTAGIAGSRSRLVRRVFEILERRRIPWVLIENVPFMLQLGRGRALNLIVRELERLGYRWAYRVVDTNAFGLPQRRERVFLLASRVGDPCDILFADDSGAREPKAWSRGRSFGFYWTEGNRGLGAAVEAIPTLKGGSTLGIPSPPAVVLPHPFKRIITPGIRDAERLQGFPEDWTLPAQGRGGRDGHRWKLVGNAVTVPVSAWIGYRLRQPGKYDCSSDQKLPGGSRWPRAARGERGQRFSSSVSTWPVTIESPRLHEFLKDYKDLSEKATDGFRSRLLASSLRRPEWFEKILDAHIERMRGSDS